MQLSSKGNYQSFAENILRVAAKKESVDLWFQGYFEYRDGLAEPIIPIEDDANFDWKYGVFYSSPMNSFVVYELELLPDILLPDFVVQVDQNPPVRPPPYLKLIVPHKKVIILNLVKV